MILGNKAVFNFVCVCRFGAGPGDWTVHAVTCERMGMYTECLTIYWTYARHFKCMISFNPHNEGVPLRRCACSSIYRSRNWEGNVSIVVELGLTLLCVAPKSVVIWLRPSCVLPETGLHPLKDRHHIFSMPLDQEKVPHMAHELNCTCYPENVLFELRFQLE